MVACGYGFLFLALAFLAEYLGGVLQAAFTIFSAVGGPLFGVFTLGMFTTYATEMVSNLVLILKIFDINYCIKSYSLRIWLW